MAKKKKQEDSPDLGLIGGIALVSAFQKGLRMRKEGMKKKGRDENTVSDHQRIKDWLAKQ